MGGRVYIVIGEDRCSGAEDIELELPIRFWVICIMGYKEGYETNPTCLIAWRHET